MCYKQMHFKPKKLYFLMHYALFDSCNLLLMLLYFFPIVSMWISQDWCVVKFTYRYLHSLRLETRDTREYQTFKKMDKNCRVKFNKNLPLLLKYSSIYNHKTLTAELKQQKKYPICNIVVFSDHDCFSRCR